MIAYLQTTQDNNLIMIQVAPEGKLLRLRANENE